MKFVSISIVALFFILLSGQNIFACSCQNPPTVEQSFEQSAAVFYGTVEEVNNYDKDRIYARFKVEKSWKGADMDEALVITDATSCGINFKTGESYYLFADREGNAFRTAACRRHAGTQEEFLQNKPTIQLKQIRRDGDYLLIRAIAVTGFIITLAVMAVMGIYFFKSRKRNGLKKE